MRRVKPVKRKSWKWRMIVGGIVLAVIGVFVFFKSSPGQKVILNVKQGCQAVADKAHLIVGQLEVEGRVNTSEQEIVKALNAAPGIPIFDVDLAKSRENLLNLPWVKTAVIERHLPSTLFIKITEKKVLAVWQRNEQKKDQKKENRYYLLDTDGKVIQELKKTKELNQLLIVGSNADQHILELQKILNKYPKILARLKSAVWIGNRRWNLYLDDVSKGLIIELPDSQIEEALAELMRRNEKENLFQKDLKVIDLRVPGQVVVRLNERKK